MFVLSTHYTEVHATGKKKQNNKTYPKQNKNHPEHKLPTNKNKQTLYIYSPKLNPEQSLGQYKGLFKTQVRPSSLKEITVCEFVPQGSAQILE